jgi:hypothetical protein
MTIPAAPTEAGADKILFVIDDNSGTNRANVLRGYKRAALNSEGVADLGVYPTSGTLRAFGLTLATGDAEQIIAASVPCQGVLVKASKNNSGTVYVGESSVTADEGAATSGYPLEPGESVGVPCRNANTVYVRGYSDDIVACIASAD